MTIREEAFKWADSRCWESSIDEDWAILGYRAALEEGETVRALIDALYNLVATFETNCELQKQNPMTYPDLLKARAVLAKLEQERSG